MITCPKCGNRNFNIDKNCSKCGASLVHVDTNSDSKTSPKTNEPPLRTKREEPVQRYLEQYGVPIFISYRRADSADVTGRIYDRLINQFGRVAVFKDVDSIPLGYDFREYLDEKVRKCRVVLVIIGDRWLEESGGSGNSRLDDPRDFVRIEIESALTRKIPIIPLFVRGASMPPDEKLPESIRSLVYRNGIAIRSDPDFHRDMDRLISALTNIGV